MTSPRRDHSGTDSGPVLGSVCTGYGGLDLGVLAALGGGRIAWVADPDPHIAQILDARLPDVPNLGDLRLIDWAAVEPVDLLVAGFPCQDISAAGRRAGIEKGTRSGLWTDIVAGLRVLRPALVIVENVAALRWKGGGLHRVLGDLAEAGYDALWRSVRAADIGAAHRRERVFLLAWHRATARADAAHTTGTRRRPPRPGRPATAPGARTPGQLARRRACPHHVTVRAAAHAHGVGREPEHPPHPPGWSDAVRPGATAADPDGSGLAFRSDPDRAQPRSADPDRLRDPDRLGAVTAQTPVGRHRNSWVRGGGGLSPAAVPAARLTAADTPRDRRDQRLPGAARLQRGLDASLDGPAPRRSSHQGQRHLVAVPDLADPAAGPPPASPDPASGPAVDWGVYAPAIRRWEHMLGRPTPYPTQPGKHRRPVLAPQFVEHLMGLSPGWVTDLELPRTAQLRALGNGVVPQQATFAISLLLADLAELLTGLSAGREVAA